jgi:hypothetical protein
VKYIVVTFKTGFDARCPERIKTPLDLRPYGCVKSSEPYESKFDAIKFKLMLETKIDMGQVAGFHSPKIIEYDI